MSNRFLLLTAALSLASFSALGCSGSSGTLAPDAGLRSPGGDSNGDEDDPPGAGSGSSSTPDDTSSSGSSSSSSSSPGGTPGDVGTIKIKNLSMAAVTNGVSLTFVLQNTGTISVERIQELTLKSGTSSATFPVSCQPYSWLLSGNQSSSVQEVRVTGIGSSSYADYGNGCTATLYSHSTTFSTSSPVTLTIKGLMDDATQWKSSATANP